MADFIRGEASPDPSLQTRVKSIAAALDEIDNAKRCLRAVADLLQPTKFVTSLDPINREDLAFLVTHLVNTLDGELEDLREEFRGLWTEVNPC